MVFNSASLSRLIEKAKTVGFSLRHDGQAPGFFENWAKDRESIQATFAEEYRKYTEQTSSPVAAVSLELAAFLYFVCVNTRPKVILDLGSGFSSYVLRRYQESQATEVYSVDDDHLWLNRTKAFLQSHNLATSNLYLWGDLLRSELRFEADLILHDLGDSRTRVNAFHQLRRFAAPRARIILDDVHKRNIREAATSWIRDQNLRYVNLASYTMDGYGRYQWFVTAD
jgi:predicted O-methyltransferase YrrM